MREIFIGVDNGYGNTKGSDFCILSGVKKLTMKPPIEQNTVEYNGEFFAVNVQKTTIQKSKTDNENTLIATLAVIGAKFRKMGICSANVRLAVGLPLTRMGAEKKDFYNYMSKNKKLNFKYEGKSYFVNLISVDVFPQGYAGVVNMLDTFGTSTVVIDIGSWTIDILPIVEGQPDLSRCKSLPLGTITSINEINEKLRQKFNGEADEAIIKEVMIKGKSVINKEYLKVIQDGLKSYVDDIMDNLRALKFNPVLTEFVFIGGGASTIKNFCKEITPNMKIIEDVNINAKGYEDLLRHKYGEVN